MSPFKRETIQVRQPVTARPLAIEIIVKIGGTCIQRMAGMTPARLAKRIDPHK